MVPGNALTLTTTTSSSGTTSTAAVGAFELAGDADEVTVTIKDSNGLDGAHADLRRSRIPAFTTSRWDGTTDSGAQAADGNYTISVAATNGSDTVDDHGFDAGLGEKRDQQRQRLHARCGCAGHFHHRRRETDSLTGVAT